VIIWASALLVWLLLASCSYVCEEYSTALLSVKKLPMEYSCHVSCQLHSPRYLLFRHQVAPHCSALLLLPCGLLGSGRHVTNVDDQGTPSGCLLCLHNLTHAVPGLICVMTLVATCTLCHLRHMLNTACIVCCNCLQELDGQGGQPVPAGRER
jgi:hypothetical protein